MLRFNPKAYAALLCALVPGAAAAQDVRRAETMISPELAQEIGRVLPRMESIRAIEPQAVAMCRATCDAFTLRQPVLAVEWEATGSRAVPGPQDSQRSLRLDIAGTSSGFEEGNFSTVNLSRVPEVDAVVLDPPSPMPLADVEVLLNEVRDNQIVARAPELPIFLTPDILQNSLPSLAPAERAAIDADLRTGGLGQIRVVGQATTELRDDPHQIVTMVGLQPGGTYRLRLVEETSDTGRILTQQICRIPVCPADFVEGGPNP